MKCGSNSEGDGTGTLKESSGVIAQQFVSVLEEDSNNSSSSAQKLEKSPPKSQLSTLNEEQGPATSVKKDDFKNSGKSGSPQETETKFDLTVSVETQNTNLPKTKEKANSRSP